MLDPDYSLLCDTENLVEGGLMKTVWLWNHYATSMAINRGGITVAENLKKSGFLSR